MGSEMCIRDSYSAFVYILKAATAFRLCTINVEEKIQCTTKAINKENNERSRCLEDYSQILRGMRSYKRAYLVFNEFSPNEKKVWNLTNEGLNISMCSDPQAFNDFVEKLFVLENNLL